MLFDDLSVEAFDPGYTGSEVRFVVQYEGRNGNVLHRAGCMPNPLASNATVLVDSVALRTGDFVRSRWRRLEVYGCNLTSGRFVPGPVLLAAQRVPV